MYDLPKFFLVSLPVLIVETVVMLGLAVWRFPIRTLILVCFVTAVVLGKVGLILNIAIGVVAMLVAWNLLGRLLAATVGDERVKAAYQWTCGRRLYNTWRRWWLYERRWQSVLEGQHLTRIKNNGYDDVPKLSKLTATRSVDTARVKVLPGQTPLDFIGMDGQTARNLAKGFNARELRVTDIPQTDYVTWELPRGDDPLADVVPFPGIPQSTADVDLRRIPIGVDERGRTITIPIQGSQTLVAGQTGAGKGSVFWSIILHLLPYVREGSVKLVALDPKRGVELNPGRNLFAHFADTDEDIQTMLARMVTVMDDNSDYIKSKGLRKLDPTPERPMYVIFIDELGRLATDKNCKESIRTLINVGRAPGCNVVAAAQNATKAIVEDRDEMPGKITLRLENVDSVRKLLGRTTYLAGARAEEIPRSLPGVGYCKVDESADDFEDSTTPRWLGWLPWVSPQNQSTAMPARRFRAYWIPNELIEQANQDFAPQPELEPASEAAVS